MMQTWSITLYGPAGVISAVDTGESQFVVGTETASDVFTVHGEGIMPRHAWVWISETGLQVEDLGGGTLVNGHTITERVQVEYPASVQVGEVTLMIELKAVQPVAVSPTPSSLDITIPQRAVTKSKASMEVTIPQRTPTRSNVQKIASTGTSSADSNAANKAPLTGEYTLVREIARGGMGQIYFGEDPQLERQVAVKVSSISEDGEDPRFSKEAKVLAQLAHPNIVPIYNIGVDAQSRPFYSMKLIKGRTLQAVLNQIRDGDAAALNDYPIATLLTVFRKVCDAMMFAHSKGILHRDLKPENIMVGEYGEVLVMDWGLAKVLGEQENTGAANSRVNDTGDYGMTMEGEVMGTPQYMSPEQAMGMVAELDQRSDIYSLGGILYAILTLRPPIDGTTLDEVLTKVKNGSLSAMVTKRGGKASVNVGAPTAMGAEVPEALQAVTLKAMATDRNKRYASVEAFAGDIERYQNGFATQAEDAGALKRLLLFIKRNKAVSSAAALFLVAVLAFTAKLAASEKTAREHERQAVAQTEKSRRAAADAQMSLAEAAEAVSDSGALKKALDAVPEDLRPPDWNYFQSRIDTATLTVDAPSGMTWRDVADFPSEPEAIVALRSDGELFKINLKSGAQQSLWRFNPPGVRGVGPMAVSGDGALLAIRYQQGTNDSVWVGSLNAGTPVSSFSEPANLNARAMELLDEICMVRGPTTLNAGVLKIEVWNHRSGSKLWEMIGSNSAFSSDQKSVLVVSGSGQVQKRNLLTGEIQASAVHPVGVHAWYLLNGMGTSDWKTFFSNQGGSRALRSLDPWTGKVHYEIAPKHGNFVSVLMDPTDSFLTLGKTSTQAGVMELRESSSGQLMRSLPFVQVTDGLDARKVLSKANAAMVCFPSAIKIWRLGKVAPLVNVRFGGSGIALSGIPNRYMIWTGFSIDLMEFSSENSKSRLISRIKIDGIKGESLVSDRSERRWLDYWGGGIAALGLDDSELKLVWGPKSIQSLGYHSVALHPDGELIWTGSSVLEWSSGSELVKVPDRKSLRQVFYSVWVGSDRVVEIVYSGQASSQEQHENSAAGLVRLALWDAKRGELLTSVDAPNADWICVSPDGHQLAEAGSDKRVRIRNAHTLKVEQEFRVHEEGVTGIAWHPSQPLLVTSAKDGMIRIWNLRDLSMAEEWLTGVPSSMPRREMYRLQRIEIAPNGLELNVYRSSRLLVYRPQSFSNQK